MMPMVDASRNDDGVSGAAVLWGERTAEGSRLASADTDDRRSCASPISGERIAGQRDLSVGSERPCAGSR